MVVIDDGNATGGTAMAVRELLEKSGMSTLGFLTAIQYHYKQPRSEYLKWLEEGGFESSFYDL